MATDGSATSPVTVLVAEDEALIRMDLVELLGECGYQVVGQVSDGQAAVDQARTLRPDVVFMDVSMPRRDGLSAAEEIIAERDEVMRVAGAADKIKEELDSRLKAMIGEAPAGRSPSGRIVTWTTKSRDAYEVKATTWRELRVKPAKGEE